MQATPFAANSTFRSIQDDFRLALFIGYIVLGISAIVTNVLTLCIVCSNKKLCARSALIVGLAGGHLLNGIHAFGFGTYRLSALLDGTIHSPMSIGACLATMLTFCTLLGYALPVVLQSVAGVERLLAVTAFGWYRTRCLSSKRSWRTVGIVYLVTILVLIPPVIYDGTDARRPKVTKECKSVSVIDRSLVAVLFCFLVTAGTIALVCLLAAVIIGRRRTRMLVARRASEERRLARQLRVSTMLLMVAVFEVILVVIPNVLLAIRSLLSECIGAAMSIYAAMAFCANSTSNIFIYLLMNRDFNRAASSLFAGCRR